MLLSWSAVERRDIRRAALAALAGFLAVQMKLPGIATAVAPVLVLLVNTPIPRRGALGAAIAAAGPLLSYLFLRLSPLGTFLGIQDEARLEPLTSMGANWDALWDSARTSLPAAVTAQAVLGMVWLARVSRRHLVIVLGMLGAWIAPWLLLVTSRLSATICRRFRTSPRSPASGLCGWLVVRAPGGYWRVSLPLPPLERQVSCHWVFQRIFHPRISRNSTSGSTAAVGRRAESTLEPPN